LKADPGRRSIERMIDIGEREAVLDGDPLADVVALLVPVHPGEVWGPEDGFEDESFCGSVVSGSVPWREEDPDRGQDRGQGRDGGRDGVSGLSGVLGGRPGAVTAEVLQGLCLSEVSDDEVLDGIQASHRLTSWCRRSSCV
jgi:hypothetical protein